MSSVASRVASASQVSAICSGLYDSWHSPGSMYAATSSGCTIASDLNSRPGAAIRQSALNARISVCASGSDSHEVPSRFQMNATASIRSTSTPRVARNSSSPAIARKTAGFA